MTSTLKADKIEGVTASGTVQMPAGMVIQTVSANTNTQVSVDSTSYVSTGLSLNITPKFSSSKILISFSAVIYIAGEGEWSIVTCYRESGTASSGSAISGTDLAQSGVWGLGALHCDTTSNVVAANGGVLNCAGIEDSPSTTSQLRYTIAYRNYDTATNYFCINTTRSTLVAQEIAQ